MSDNELNENRISKSMALSFEVIVLILFVFIGGVAMSVNQKTLATDEKKTEVNSDLETAVLLFKHNSEDKFVYETFKKYADQDDKEALIWLSRWHMASLSRDLDQIYHIGQKLMKMDEPFGDYLTGLAYFCGFVVKENDEEALKYLNSAAEKGVPEAMFALAQHYDADLKLSENYLQQALAKDFVPAKSEYGYCLLKSGRYEEALKFLESADDFVGYNLLADYYLNGKNTPVDSLKALEYAEKAVKATRNQAFVPAFFQRIYSPYQVIYTIGLEEYLLNGATPLAERCVKLAADAGEIAAAQYLYAFCLSQRCKDDANVQHYFEKAAKQGMPSAEFALGIFHKERGNLRAAEKYFLMALNNSIYYEQSLCYLTDVYFEKDVVNAEHFAYLGALQDNVYCRNAYALLSLDRENPVTSAAILTLSVIEGDEKAEGFLAAVLKNDLESIKQEAEAGNADAMFVLSEYYKKNPSDSAEYQKGIDFFEKAVNFDSPIGCYVLAEMYLQGNGVKQDLWQAAKYYLKSMYNGWEPAAKKLISLLAVEEKFKCISRKDIEMLCEYVDDNNLNLEFFMGMIYNDFFEDTEQAEKILRKGAARGDVVCMHTLYLILKDDKPDEAMSFLYQAINENYYAAFLTKGDIDMENGKYREAYVNYLKASLLAADNLPLEKLAACKLQGYGCTANFEHALHWAEEAFDNGSASVCLMLGNLYSDGKFCPQDMEKARKYYTVGIERGNEECKTALEKLDAAKPVEK